MAKINGTSLLVYADGVLIAAQTGCTVRWEQDLPPATTKDSAGWEEHINGVRRAICDFDGLYSTTGLNASGLIADIIARDSVVLVIDGGGFPIVGEADCKNVSINAVKEEAASISGSFKFNGPAWMLTGAYVNLMTDPDGRSNEYDTMTVSGISIASAINAAGGVTVLSNTFSVTNAASYKVITFLTKNSGQLPECLLRYNSDGSALSNAVSLVEGVNVITLVATDTSTGCLGFGNTAACNWSTSNIYCFKI